MLFLLASLGTVTSAYTLEPCVYRTDQFGYSTPCLCGLIFFFGGVGALPVWPVRAHGFTVTGDLLCLFDPYCSPELSDESP